MARVTTFGRKLGLGFAAVVLLTVVMGVVAVTTLGSVVEQKDHVISHSTENLVDAQRLLTAMEKEVAGYRGFLLTGDAALLERMTAADEDFTDALARIRERDLSAEHTRLVAEVEAAETEHQREVDRLVEQKRQGVSIELIVTEVEARLLPRRTALEGRLATFLDAERAARDEMRDAAGEAASAAIRIEVGLAIGVVLVALVIAAVLTRTLSRQIGGSVQQVRSSSAELHATANQQASSSKEQATAMREISTTIGELLATSTQIAESAQRVAKIAADAATGAREGDSTVSDAQTAVSNIRGQVDTIVQHMLELGRKSQQIGGILELINELAEQTNILAINATIEAAGAGDAGRRFAVVGEEIRRLADRVSGSTKEIRALIEEMRAAVNSTVMATESGSKTVDAGAERFAQLASAFRRIAGLVETTTQAAREIELSTKQQTTAVEQVNVAIANVAQTTKESEAASTQTLQTAGELTSLSDDLARLVQAQA